MQRKTGSTSVWAIDNLFFGVKRTLGSALDGFDWYFL
jgi:hypothetical protein